MLRRVSRVGISKVMMGIFRAGHSMMVGDHGRDSKVIGMMGGFKSSCVESDGSCRVEAGSL